MNDNPIDVEGVAVEIVRCPRCGALNRLLEQGRNVSYLCGGCGVQLGNPFAKKSNANRSFQGNPRKSSSRLAGKFVGGFIVAIVVVAVVMRHQDPQPSLPTFRSFPTPPAPIATANPRSSPLASLTAPASPHPAIFPQPASPPPLEVPEALPNSLENGTVLTDMMEMGHGKFTVKNDTDRDAVVKLIDERRRQTAVAFYITAYGTATIDEVPDRSFVVLCGQGVDWDDNARVFKKDRSFEKLKPDMDFSIKVEQTESQIIRRYQIITLELAPRVDGNIKHSGISEKAFLEY